MTCYPITTTSAKVLRLFLSDRRLTELYPALEDQYDHGKLIPKINQTQQALNQLYAFLVTIAVALVGGVFTGMG